MHGPIISCWLAQQTATAWPVSMSATQQSGTESNSGDCQRVPVLPMMIIPRRDLATVNKPCAAYLALKHRRGSGQIHAGIQQLLLEVLDRHAGIGDGALQELVLLAKKVQSRCALQVRGIHGPAVAQAAA